MASNKRRREKVVLVFNEKDRREFVTGFHKRKNERRKKAKEELKKKEEEKRKQTRAEKREALRQQTEGYEARLDVFRSGQEAIEAESVTHDFGEHTVTVSTITDEDMGKDFMPLVDSNETQKPANKKIIQSVQEGTRHKIVKKKKFRKKAQKRKIQALSDKKLSKHKLKKKGLNKNQQS